jgi:glutamate carboxypeptidase
MGEGLTPDRELLDEVFEETVALLEGLCATSSESGDAEGLAKVAARLAASLEPFGLSGDTEDATGADGSRQPVLVCRGARATETYTLVLGHLDTVLSAAPPRRDGSRLRGTGALDMKGGLAAFVGALRLMARRGDSIPGDLLFVGVPDEEVGGPISERLVGVWGERAHAMLVLEPGSLRPGGAESLVTGRRGLTVWRLESRGRAAHSGLAYWQGRSALAAAATWCGAVQRMSEQGRGPVVNVGRIVGGDSEFVQDLGEEHHFVGTSQRLNIVPDRCIAEGEVRYLRTDDRDRVVAAMREIAGQLAAGWGVDMELTEVESLPPVAPNGPGALVAARLVEAARQEGWCLEIEEDRGGVSFSNFLPDPSSVIVLDGLGPCGAGMHTRDEYVDLLSLRRRIPLIAEAIELLSAQR